MSYFLTLAIPAAAGAQGAAGENESLNILITGIVVVFSVLLLLIGIIKLYATIVFKTQTEAKEKANKKTELSAVQTEVSVPKAAQVLPFTDTFDGIDSQTVAVIAAAVACMDGGESLTVCGIRRSNGSAGRSAWTQAGIIDSVRPFTAGGRG